MSYYGLQYPFYSPIPVRCHLIAFIQIQAGELPRHQAKGLRQSSLAPVRAQRCFGICFCPQIRVVEQPCSFTSRMEITTMGKLCSATKIFVMWKSPLDRIHCITHQAIFPKYVLYSIQSILKATYNKVEVAENRLIDTENKPMVTRWVGD